MVINGYKIPGKMGGIGVRRAAQLVLTNPGIKTEDLHAQAAWFADLNHATAGWMVSPKDGPVGLLWERRKEGRGFRHYPNEFTEAATAGLEEDARKVALEKFLKYNRNIIGARPGDLLQRGETDTVLFLGIRVANSYARLGRDGAEVALISDATEESFLSAKDFTYCPLSFSTVRYSDNGTVYESDPALDYLKLIRA